METHSDLAVIAARMEVLHDDVKDMKDVLWDLTSAITKLALIEERQTQTSLALERAFKTLERVEQRIKALEVNAPTQVKIIQWVDRLIIASIALILFFAVKHLGLV